MPDECPDVTGGRGYTPLHRRYFTFEDLRRLDATETQLERIESKLDTLLARTQARPAMAAVRWELP